METFRGHTTNVSQTAYLDTIHTKPKEKHTHETRQTRYTTCSEPVAGTPWQAGSNWVSKKRRYGAQWR